MLNTVRLGLHMVHHRYTYHLALNYVCLPLRCFILMGSICKTLLTDVIYRKMTNHHERNTTLICLFKPGSLWKHATDLLACKWSQILLVIETPHWKCVQFPFFFTKRNVSLNWPHPWKLKWRLIIICSYLISTLKSWEPWLQLDC